MALKALMLRNKISEKQKELESLRTAAKTFETREKELEASIAEAKTEEEKKAVEEAVAAYDTEVSENQKVQKALQTEIEAAETEIREIEAAAPSPAPADPEKRKENHTMINRTKFFNMSHQERDEFFARDEVKDFLHRTREFAKQSRTVTNAELAIPDSFLGVVRENINLYSKLISKVNLRPVPGTSRMLITGAVPEAIWTEATGSLNGLSFALNQVVADGYKVGGVIFLCNAMLEDSDDLPLATEIITNLGASIGLAVDKAILYGTGVHMPMGIITRLAQAAKPSDYDPKGRDWADLHTSNIVKLAVKTGVAMFQGILGAFKAAKHDYSNGGKFWVMNESTYTSLQIEAMAINAAGAIVSGQTNTMPVVGGDIVTLNFIPDGDIIAGYPDLYLLAQRAGVTMGQSEHVRFVDDQTAFKATARYDGKPIIPEAFVLMNIANAAPTTTVSFAPDTANATPPEGDS